MSIAFDMAAALEEFNSPKFDWVHPSWRDVVIEYLMAHPADRRRFLSRCGVDGLGLALSVSGGRDGERTHPLLQHDDDWVALRLRAVQLIPSLSAVERTRLLHSLRGLGQLDDGRQPILEQIGRLQREVLQTLVADWNAAHAPIALAALTTFYEVSLQTRPLVPGPELDATWHAIEAELPNGDDDWIPNEAFRFLAIVAKNEPRFLTQIEWPDRFAVLLAVIQRQATAFHARANALVDQITRREPVDEEEAVDVSTSAPNWRRLFFDMEELGVASPRDQMQEVDVAETIIDDWFEEEALRAAEEAEMVEEGDDEPTPNARPFDLNAMFSDL